MLSTDHIRLSPEIERATKGNQPVVALESTVITHGLPYPQNLQLARDMEASVRREGAIPATVGVIEGEIRVGLSDEELTRLAGDRSALKVSQRDFAAAIVKKANGGTTVAGTMSVCFKSRIGVFATGGIGGVHRESANDISTDLPALALTSMIVVCAGAKAILDLPATLEYLETMGVPVIGYQTDEFPAFYSRESGLNVSTRLDTPGQIVEFARAHRAVGLHSAVLVANPIPDRDALPKSELDPILERASREAKEKQIHGQALTPFLLGRVSDLTHGRALRANLALLRNNARLAAQIAKAEVGR